MTEWVGLVSLQQSCQTESKGRKALMQPRAQAAAGTPTPALFRRVSGDWAFSRALQISSQSGVSGGSSHKNAWGCTSCCSPFSKGAIRLSFLYREIFLKKNNQTTQTLMIMLFPEHRIMFPGYLILLWNVFTYMFSFWWTLKYKFPPWYIDWLVKTKSQPILL